MRVVAFIRRIIQQMLRDKRALALMMVAPLLILTLLHYLFSVENPTPTIGVSNLDNELIEQLKEKEMDVTQYDSPKNIEKIIIDNDLDGYLQENDKKIDLILQNDQPSVAKAIQIKVQQAIAATSAEQQKENLSEFMLKIQQALPGDAIELSEVEVREVETTYLYGDEDTTYFDQLSPILVGFFVFFFVFIISGIAILKERTSGTLDRLMATPIQRHEIVFGYVLGYGIFAIIQTIIVVFYAVKVLQIMMIGSIWNVILINLTLALVALSLGTLLSAFANSEFQMMQFIPIVIIPQIFFAGIIPVETMANWLQVIAKCMPLYYGGSALVDVMYKGLGMSSILNYLLVLLGFSIVFIILNIFALKKYRKV